MELGYRDEVVLGDRTYAVGLDSDGDRLAVTVTGAEPDGEVVVEASLELPPTAVGEIQQVLRRVFDGVTQLDFTRDVPAARAGSLPANNGVPWTDADDRTLRADWLAASPHSRPTAVIRELAAARDRTPGGIRSRLPRVGCDRERPGCSLEVADQPAAYEYLDADAIEDDPEQPE